MTLITDRTQADVDYVKSLRDKILAGTATAEEETEFLTANLKGAYNAADLNRVGNAMLVVAKKLGVPVNPKTDWAATDIPTPVQLANYITDLQRVHDAVHGAPDIPGSAIIDYAGANAIEEMLLYADDYADRINAPRANLAYSGGTL